MSVESSPASREAAPSSPLVRAAERMVTQIEALVAEVTSLRESNSVMRRELREALAYFERGGAALAARSRPDGDGQRRVRRRTRGPKGRATPAAVTTDVVRAVLAKLGEATAAEIAAEITTAGVAVSGRAVRFLAEAAGAQTVVGDDGRRRYSL